MSKYSEFTDQELIVIHNRFDIPSSRIDFSFDCNHEELVALDVGEEYSIWAEVKSELEDRGVSPNSWH